MLSEIVLNLPLKVVKEGYENEFMEEEEIDVNASVVMYNNEFYECIKDANNIIVLDGGKIVEQGTHEKLLENNSLYVSIVNLSLISAAALIVNVIAATALCV